MSDGAQPNAHVGTLVLSFERGVEPIRGWIETAPGIRRPFSGWLELMSALQEERRKGDARVGIAATTALALRESAPGPARDAS
jgi:hypothetical protein